MDCDTALGEGATSGISEFVIDTVDYNIGIGNILGLPVSFNASTSLNAPPAYKTIKISNPPGVNSSAGACLITTGLTRYIANGDLITNGVEIFTDSGLTNRLFTSDPLAGGFFLWAKDDTTTLEYAITFDGTGLVDVVVSC